ncbi:adenylyl-sulfate kinase [Pseudodesulfovibrio pelocollis]|uniref:adenylyl-sulfate kinase n=1 Tax=Pseudodesulfovibrio pelocollis TaxID=3051432 RepID=UPI00255ADD8D|nr:adenylyl-sulfate kinase [Pseudodesulfovibrio sp. SB368]
MKPGAQGFAVWFVGLPGSGKSALARGVADHLRGRGVDVILLQMDERRKAYFPEPQYTAREREAAYAMFVDEAVELVGQGHNVLMDGSAHTVSMRDRARSRIPRFAEVFVRCELDEAIRREAGRPEGLVAADLYRRALRRRQTGEPCQGLGEVIGVDVPFEEDPGAEFTIDNTRLTREQTLGKVLHFLDTWFASA